jgi:hypothetical protein
MRHDPIDYNSPMGISKKEWVRVLGVNLALLLLAYCVALVFTLCGNGAFLLNFENAQLESMETTLRSIGIYPLVQMGMSTIEEVIILSYVLKQKPKWWWPVIHLGVYVGLNYLMMATIGHVLSFTALALGILFSLGITIYTCIKKKEKPWFYLLRLVIAIAVSFVINEAIAIFRTKAYEIGVIYENSSFFALSIEYDLALALALGFLTLLIPWEKGGKPQWETPQAAGGSSPTSKRWSRKNSLTKNNLNPKQRKKIALLKAKVIVIKTVALAVIAALPWFAGRPVEFTLLYLAFCLTRVILGFSHSLHFKSELSCVTIGALTFWGLTFLAPSAKASIILSLVYGAGLALGFRLYWELHDLMMYRRAAKTDRYAMLYTAFKGNTDPRHIRGVMRLRGHNDEDEIKMVQCIWPGRRLITYRNG